MENPKKIKARIEVKQLVEKYKSYKKQGLLRRYNEDNTCKDFILPLFKALGWGVETSREVEGQKNVSGGRVDYAFYIDGIPKYFLEAKAIPEDLNKESYIKQAIDYAYNKGVTWAILSDFEGIKVFNAEWHTTPAKACVLNLSVDDYLIDFDLLWELSKEGIEQNLLYERARKIGQVAVKEPVGERLYKDLTLWRELFFKYISGYHPDFSFAQVDEIIQRILNRFVFIRTCEDREIETPYLLPLVREWKSSRNINLQQKIKEIFKDFDSWYNSKLFAHHLCDEIDIEDTPYAEVIEGLYGSKDEIVRYDFSAIGVDVLGRVYEQYLGYVAKSVEPKRKRQLALEGLENELIKIEKEKKRRKEQGIYYTPTYIVDYIVKNTLKPVLDKCTCVEDLKKIKVLDPACGSGSFLIKALEVINDKYKEFNYAGDELTKIQILNENIYGVDLDEQAVEIARLNLLLNSLDRRMELPLLKNIRNGNSLISGTDEKLKKHFGENFRDKKPFNWQEEFPEVFAQGGFDVVIGNPPYINAMNMSKNFDESTREYLKNYYESAKGAYDLYLLFMEKGLQLLKSGGYLSFITPNKYLSASYAVGFRNFVLENCQLKQIVDLSQIITFTEASTYSIISLFEKTKDKNYSVQTLVPINNDLSDLGRKKLKIMINDSRYLSILPENIWGYLLSDKLDLIKKIIKQSTALTNYAEISATSTAAEADTFSSLITSNYSESSFKIINTGTIDRYISLWGVKEIINKGKKILTPYLSFGTNTFTDRRKIQYSSPKIIFAKIGLRPEAMLDINSEYASINTNCLYFPKHKIPLKYFLAYVNSNLFHFIYNQFFGGLRMGGGYYQYQAPQLKVMPFKTTNSVQTKTVTNLVDNILKLNQQAQLVPMNSNKWNSIKLEIEKTDQKIDDEVYKLYKLTPEEIKIIEKG